jgi:hypothetical protein
MRKRWKPLLTCQEFMCYPLLEATFGSDQFAQLPNPSPPCREDFANRSLLIYVRQWYVYARKPLYAQMSN